MSTITNHPDEQEIERVGVLRSVSAFAAPREAAFGVILQKLGRELQERGFGVTIASSLKDAANLVMERLLPQSKAQVVSFGGSMTVRDAGLLEAMQARPDLTVLDTFDYTIGQEEMIELRRRALLCDFFVCSANAITRQGDILLVDGVGNRTAAVQFGPRKVVLLVGRNKICASLDSAIEYIKGIAAPANAIRLSKKTPCVKTGYCMDCKSQERLCAYWTVIKRSRPQAGRIHVVLVDEDCGF